MLSRPVPQPKPEPRVTDRVGYRREREAKDYAFRAAVWARDERHCRVCGRLCRRTVELCPEQGHVHHRRARNVAPQDRFNPDAAVLVCATCHQRLHAHEVEIPT
jgi:5-methylcytosine-specific restriction endonuclease McrA